MLAVFSIKMRISVFRAHETLKENCNSMFYPNLYNNDEYLWIKILKKTG